MEVKCKVDCPCGWSDVFSAGYSGLQIHCPQCGKRHRIPMFSQPRADDEIDMEVMKRLLSTGGEGPQGATVNFKPLLLGTLAFAVAASVIGTVLVLLLVSGPRVPVLIATVTCGAFAWPLAVSVAWWGQKRHQKRLREQDVQA
jgi:hypothetical protein